MKLQNFRLHSPGYAVEISSDDGRYFDLHNFAKFDGISFDPEKDRIFFKWTIRNDQAVLKNIPHEVVMEFEGIRLFEMSKRDGEYPLSEAATLEGISMVDPIDREWPHRKEWAENQPFHLLFAFHDKREIRIDAVSVRLIARVLDA